MMLIFRKIHITPKENPISENSDCKNLKDGDQSNCFPAELEDGDCNQDCIFKNDSKNLDDQIARIEQIDFGDPPQVIAEEPIGNDHQKAVENGVGETLYFFRENGPTSETHLKNGIAAVKDVIESEIDNLPSELCETGEIERTVQNGDSCRIADDSESPWDSHQRDSRERRISESLSESDAFLGVEKTVESSTETIVADGPR